jgi:CDP-glucose 4,6-dehydratase
MRLDRYKRFYKGKKVLVTGHTGFIGSWLTKVLSVSDSAILGYSLNPPTSPSMYDAIRLSKGLMDLRKDVRDKESLKKVIQEFEPEIVFHLAAQPIVLESYDNPVETFETNVMGTVNLLESLRRVGSAKVIVVMTSDKVYKNNGSSYSYREADPLGGKDPYSASKSSQDIVVNSFRESYFDSMGISISSIRAGNVIGGGDWGAHRIVPDVVRGLTEGKIIRIRNPDSVRPWQYVLEPISGMLLLAQRMWDDIKFSGEWNFGPNNQREITVKELVDEFLKKWGSGSYTIAKDNEAREANYLQLDISKAKSVLSWFPKYNFEEIIDETVGWYRAYYEDKDNIINVTEKQIRAYFEGGNNE